MSEGFLRFPGMILIHHGGEHEALMMCAGPPKGQKKPKTKPNRGIILRCLCWKKAGDQACAEAAAVKAIRGKSHRSNVGMQWVDITLTKAQRYVFSERSQSARSNHHLHEDERAPLIH